MTTYEDQPVVAGELRARAEVASREKSAVFGEDLASMTPAAIGTMLHELRVHQIELEMQNEELRHVQHELDASRACYFDLYDRAPVGYCTLSEAGLILEANLTVSSLLGVVRSALVKRPITRFIAPEYQDIYYRHRNELFATGKPQTVELRMMKGDDTKFWAYLAATATKDAAGALTCRVVLSDITQRKRTEAELLNMQKLKSLGVLAGGIAHDFNNIMMGLFGNISLAKEDLPRGHPGIKSLENAEKSMARAICLANQLLTFSSGGDPVKEAVSLGSFVEESARFDLSGSNIMLVYEQESDLWRTQADKGQIRQVIANLIINARQAMPGGGYLYVSLNNAELPEGALPGMRAGKFIRISVRDEGCGIDPKHMERIFDPYFTTKTTGHGLGLATTYSIISKHGGHIAVESQLGKGTTFTLYLPAIACPPISQDGSAVSEPPPLKPATRILVLDDEEYIRMVTARWFKKIGCVAETTGNSQQAIDLYQQAMLAGNPFDVIILDLTIPGGMGGLEVLGAIRALDPNVKAIVSSGYADGSVMSNHAAFGFMGALAKPYTERDLYQLVGQLA